MSPVPNFLCVGMPKCGTSTLHDVLDAHDGIFVPPVKELHFFAYHHIGYHRSLAELAFSKHWAAREDRLSILRVIKRVLLRQRSIFDLAWIGKYAFGRNDSHWYHSLFPADRVCGEISPSYCLLTPEEIRELAMINPDLRVIILLRSPLQQIWSHCRMSVVRPGKSHDLCAFKANIEQLTEYRATYRSLVDDWSMVFGEQVFVGYLEDMAADPRRFFADLLNFLEAPFSQEALPVAKKSHVGVSYPVPPEIRALLVEHASIRLEGFESISPARAAEWQAEIESLSQAQ